ncbi:MAG: GNAT family N-acetyltransferase [Oscillospiraceae bacterium]|nr:GNAT family N-acetyltransferase [Oscillospiraceae bacterium]
MIREITENDYKALMELYLHLHETEVPPFELAKDVWEKIVSDENYHIIVAEEDGKIVSSCTCVIIPNLTRGPRPYAWVENVVTHADYRGKGLATKCLDYAKELAIRENCYRIVLMTGSKLESTLKFYENAGYNRNDKTGYIQWL